MARNGSIQWDPRFDEYSPLPLRTLVGSASTDPSFADVQADAQHRDNVQSSPRLWSDIVGGRQSTHPKVKASATRMCNRSVTFFTLSGELRNQIYRKVLVDSQRITLTRKDVVKRKILLRICRKFRHEASSIWYAENRFLVLLSTDDFELLPSWLELMGKENRQHLTSLHDTFDIAYVFSKARVAAVDWPAKHERYLFAVTHSHHAAVHAEDIEECTHDWNEIQMLWLNLALNFLEQGLWSGNR